MSAPSASAQDAQFQYVEGQGRPSFPALLARFEALSAEAAPAGRLDIRYGEAARETYDFFPAQGEPRAGLVYFHAGYWQSRDKSLFRFIAPTFTRQGVHVALVNYPLCPHVTLAALLDAVRRSVLAVDRQLRAQHGRALPLVVAGHSAGGHLAVELGLTDWRVLPDVAAPPTIAGVLALSGVYDLVPLVDTSLNVNLALDPASAQRHSPLLRAASGAPPALFAVGGAETPDFVAQSRDMHRAWEAAGNASSLSVVGAADHFSLLEQLVQPGSALQAKALALIAQAIAGAATGAAQEAEPAESLGRRRISSGSTFEEQMGYSRAVVDGDWVFVSGTTGFDYAAMTIAEDIETQTAQCFRNIAAALAQAGSSLADVVRVTYVLPDSSLFPQCWPVMRAHFGAVRPAAMMISAGLADPRMKIEIEVTARKPAALPG